MNDQPDKNMKFIVENHIFRQMIKAIGKPFPATNKPDTLLTLAVLPGMVIGSTTCRAGAVLSLATEEGQCILPRAEFEAILGTLSSDEVLSFRISQRGLKVKSFSMPVMEFAKAPTPSQKYTWFGTLPVASDLSRARVA